MRGTESLLSRVGLCLCLMLLTSPVSEASVILFSRPTDTIDVSGGTILSNSATYEARILFTSTFNGGGRLFNEWVDSQEDKDLFVGPGILLAYSFPINGVDFRAFPAIGLDEWHHIAYVYDGSEERLYLDGSLLAARAASGSIGNAPVDPFVGAIFREFTIAPSLIGYVDTLRISNNARYFGTSFTPPHGKLMSDANTLILYNFLESPGSTTTEDASGNGHTGTLGVGFSGATSPIFVEDPVRDVGPEAGLVFGNGNQPFLFRGGQDILVTSGRAGILKTSDGGESWVRRESRLLDASGVEAFAEALCQARSAPEIAYVATFQNGLYRTTDFGESWAPLAPLTNPSLWDCAVDPLDAAVVYALVSFDSPPVRLFKSTDAGQSFTTVGDGLPALDSAPAGIAIAQTNPETIYVGDSTPLSGGLYVSSNGGLNFCRLPNAPPTFRIYPHPTDDGTLFVFGGGGLFRSINGGATFEQVGAGLPLTAGSLAFDPTDPSVVYSPAGVDGLFRSLDGALTFELLNGLAVGTVGVSPGTAEDPPAVYVGTSLGPFRSDDRGETFAPIRDGYHGTAVNDLAIDAKGRLLVATINIVGLFRSISPGVYEIISDTLPRDAAAMLSAVAAAPNDPEFYVVTSFASGNGSIFRTTDGGRSWTRASILGDPIFAGQRARIAFAPSDASRLYAVTPGGQQPGLYRSTDGAQSFERLSDRPLGSIAVDPRDPDVLYVGTWNGAPGLFKSTDGGRTLQQLDASGNIIAIALDPERPQVIYAGLRFGRVIRSLDGGQTFAPADRGLSGDRVLGLGVDLGQPMRLFVWMHAGGLFRSA